ncbi:hypothetical protein Hanom_Chr03g00241421 [Helianthus anomalus]
MADHPLRDYIRIVLIQEMLRHVSPLSKLIYVAKPSLLNLGAYGTGEMALRVEGLGVGGETSIEEFIIAPANDLEQDQDEATKIKLYDHEAGVSWIARPLTDPMVPGIHNRPCKLQVSRKT